MHFAQALLCETPRADGFACGTCASCGYVAAGQHPDLRVLEPLEVDDDGEAKARRPHRVDRMRELIEWVAPDEPSRAARRSRSSRRPSG